MPGQGVITIVFKLQCMSACMHDGVFNHFLFCVVVHFWMDGEALCHV